MKASNGPVKQAGWREYSQGGVVAGLMVVSLYAVASNCVQIDAAPKVADYYNQYRDYRDQYNQVVDWKDRVDTSGLMALMPEGMQGASDLLEERYQAANGFYEAYQNGLEGVQGEHAIASMRQQGPLTRAEWANGVNAPNDDPKLCYQLDMGADIGLMAQTGEPNTLSQRCGPEGRQALANHSVRPSRDGSGMAPNTAQATEVTRAVMGGEFSMLDVVRGDLAWLRDNPEYHTPFRYPRESFDISPEEAARHSAALQRVGGIMAGRGFAAFGYEPLRLEQSGLVDTESAYGATTLLARLNLVYDGMGRYATAYPRVAGLRDTLLDFDSNMIDAANEGERHGIDLQLRALEGDLSALRVESRQREERLMGTLLSEYVSEQSTGLRGGRP